MNEGIIIIYDGECPFCTTYVNYSKLKSSLDEVTLVSARDSENNWVKLTKSKGYNLDKGMVAIYKNDFYYGSDVLNLIAKLTKEETLVDKVFVSLFSSKRFSRLAYPILKIFRRIALFIKGKGLIN